MTIIAEENAAVKWREKKIRNVNTAKKMMDAGFQERGMRMLSCGTFLTREKCPDCGKSIVSSANLCRDRLCPTCAWRLSLKRYAEMCCTLQSIHDLSAFDAGFLTLTVRNCDPADLKFTLEKMAEDWHRMLCDRKVRAITIGWARSLEITYNWRTGQFHPHYHVIMLTENGGDQATLQQFFRDRWQVCTRLPYEPITDYRTIDSAKAETPDIDNNDFTKAILETYKYSVKNDDIQDMPITVFRQFVTAIAGKRFCSYGGIIKQARQRLGYKDKEELEDDDLIIERKHNICGCGGVMEQEVLQWSFTERQYVELKKMLSKETQKIQRRNFGGIQNSI